MYWFVLKSAAVREAVRRDAEVRPVHVAGRREGTRLGRRVDEDLAAVAARRVEPLLARAARLAQRAVVLRAAPEAAAARCPATGGICGTVAIDVNCAVDRLLRATTPAVWEFTEPLRFTQSFELSGRSGRRGRRRSGLVHTPPSLPKATREGFAGSNASAWKSGCWSYPRFFQVWPPSVERKMPPEPIG